jgi:hypothetical protein
MADEREEVQVEEPVVIQATERNIIAKEFVDPQEYNSGDCVMLGGSKVTYWPGSWNVRLDARTFTRKTHSGDYWHHNIAFVDEAGNQIGTCHFESPEMDDGNPPPIYEWVGLDSGPTSFDAVKGMKVTSYSC